MFPRRAISAFILPVAIGFFVGACASVPKEKTPLDLPADSVETKATSDDPFSDVKAELASDVKDETAPKAAPQIDQEAAQPKQEATDSTPFYNPVGGEKLARVAYMLYGVGGGKKLQALNPSLEKDARLVSGEKVYFTWDDLKVQSNYLTKDLIDRYTTELAENVRGSTKELKTTVVGPKESLQMVSQRLYQTTRYWTELYLLNHQKLSGYDKIKAGTAIEYAEHPGFIVAKAATKPVPAPAPAPKEALAPVAKLKPAPVAPPPFRPVPAVAATNPRALPIAPKAPVATSPVPAPSVNPAPVVSPTTNTSPPPQASAPVPPVKKIIAPRVAVEDEVDLFSLTNIRRGIYGLLILGMLIGAYWLARSPKRKAKAKPISAIISAPAKFEAPIVPPSSPRVGVPMPTAALKDVKGQDQVS